MKVHKLIFWGPPIFARLSLGIFAPYRTAVEKCQAMTVQPTALYCAFLSGDERQMII